jgi:cyclophilin family peptidyl-prolyl cis-trans isomerase
VRGRLDQGGAPGWRDIEPIQGSGEYRRHPARKEGAEDRHPAKQYTATIATSKGKITARLFADVAQLAVNNFAFLANDHFYDGLPIFRVLPGLLAQMGDPTGSGSGGPGYTFKDDPVPANLDYVRGALAMANGDLTATGSQFFVSTDSLHEPSKTFTIFGTVTDGLGVLDQIVAMPRTYGTDGAQSRPTEPISIVSVVVTAG